MKFFESLQSKYTIEISDSRTENSFEFLKKVDINIACETSIHLEAVFLNVYPVYFKLSDRIKDVYGYIENGLITDVFEDSTLLMYKIKNLRNTRPFIRGRRKYYVSTVGNEYDGKSYVLVNNINIITANFT